MSSTVARTMARHLTTLSGELRKLAKTLDIKKKQAKQKMIAKKRGARKGRRT